METEQNTENLPESEDSGSTENHSVFSVISVPSVVTNERAITKVHRNMRRQTRRPRLTPEEIESIRIKFKEYIENTPLPIVSEFAYEIDVSKQIFYDHEELRPLTERATLKKVAAYERGMVTGTLEVAACIFALKQHGWKDRQEVENVVIDKKKAKKELEKLFE